MNELHSSEVNFCIWYESGILFLVVIQLSLHHLLKKTYSLLIELSWCPYWKSIGHEWRSLFLDFQFYSVNLYVYPYATTTLSWLL